MPTGNTEILFISGSSLDQKGTRVLVREGGAENWIWPDPGVQDIDKRLLGITDVNRELIEAFLGRGSENG